MPINVFADEVLTPGAGQIKALVCVGGNPAVAFPDQRKVVAALRALELLVVLDVKMTATARLAALRVRLQALAREARDVAHGRGPARRSRSRSTRRRSSSPSST